MRFLCTFFGVLMCGCVALTPAWAGQRQPHPPTPATVHPAPPAHPANDAGHLAPVPVATTIAANPALVARLQPLLPSGLTMASAAQGFRNQGQFIAALHVAHNLHIPFAQLKAEMTGPDHDSLGEAIHTLMPSTNAKTEAKRAQHEAHEDLQTSSAPGDDNDRR